MMKRLILLTVGLFYCFLNIGCDKSCKKSVEEVATIQNMTGRTLSLSICKGRIYGEAQITLDRDSRLNQQSLGTREDSEIKGGFGDVCSGVKDDTQTMEIALAPGSFGQVKLCYDDANKRNVVVEAYQLCPTGFMEQTAIATCGSAL